MIDWPAILTTIISATALGILTGAGWFFSFAIQKLTGSQEAFIAYLQKQTESQVRERDEWRAVLKEHTDVSRQMYRAMEETRGQYKAEHEAILRRLEERT